MKKRLLGGKKVKTIFPSPDLIYRSDVVIGNDPTYNKNKITNNKKRYTEDSEHASTAANAISGWSGAGRSSEAREGRS